MGDSGQAVPLYVAFLVVILAMAAVALGCVSAAIAIDRRQSIADVAALSGAAALQRGATPDEAVAAAVRTARANGFAASAKVPDRASPMPVRVAVEVVEPVHVGAGPAVASVPVVRTAEAMVTQPLGLEADPGPGDYPGPFAWRQGRPMRPDVAIAFDRMAAAAAAAGRQLVINSAWRSTSEQARLFAARPDPRWVAPPGRSLHRLGTELDLGPDAAWPWLLANAGRFGFLRRYPWEPWHFGYTLNPGSASVGWGRLASAGAGHRSTTGALPDWVPAGLAGTIRAASVRHGIAAAVLAAQLRAESDFRTDIVSSAGAQGIAQLMPYESRRLRVDPFDPAQAIDAQARLMRELLSRFGTVPLALAAYNAGPGAVSRCGCIPPYPETRTYVARIIGWLKQLGGGTPSVVLVA